MPSSCFTLYAICRTSQSSVRTIAPSPRNETIGQDDVKSTLETDSDQGRQMDIFSLIEQRFYLQPIRISGDGGIPAFATQTRDQIFVENETRS